MSKTKGNKLWNCRNVGECMRACAARARVCIYRSMRIASHALAHVKHEEGGEGGGVKTIMRRRACLYKAHARVRTR